MTRKRNSKKLIYSLLALFLLVLAVIGGGGVGVTYAATSANSVVTSYEQQNVLDDLKGSTISGKEFELSDYSFNEKGTPEIVSFVEFGYSYKLTKQSDYGLYLYLYNPQGLKFDTDTERNKIQFAHGEKANWNKYVLEFLNYSTQAGYEGLFYKFKIVLSESQRSSLLSTLSQDLRVYEISGVELSVNGVVTDYCINYNDEPNKILKYSYSGYVEGYGSELATEDTLTCTVDGVRETLSLNVHSTYWRPKGTHSDGYTKDTLHSVYFSVPNRIIEQYGEMTAVHATWLNAYTAPIFVTGNSNVYNALLPYVAKYMDGGTYKDYESVIPYALIATQAAEGFREAEEAAHFGYYAYNAYSLSGNANVDPLIEYDRTLEYLNYLFLAEDGDADNYTLSAQKLVGDKEKGIKGWFETFTERFGGFVVGGDLGGNDIVTGGDPGIHKDFRVLGKYSYALFDYFDKAFTDVTIEATKEYKLTDNTVSDNVWDRLFGNTVKKENSYQMSAIQKVTSSDISFYSNAEAFCNKFYVAESDYADFCSYVTTAERNDETVYLFRYYQTEYVSHEVTEFERVKKWALIGGNHGGYKAVDTNAYFAQEWVQLDFDIIDLTFTKNGVKTVIPVVMSPMDIVAGAEPPASTQPPKEKNLLEKIVDFFKNLWNNIVNFFKGFEWWHLLLLGLGVLLALGLIIAIVKFGVQAVLSFLWWLIKKLFKGLWWLITLPFRLIYNAISGGKKE